MHTRSKRWVKSLLICLVVAFVAGIVWITLEDVSSLDASLDIRLQAARSAAVAYGTLREDAGHRQIVVEEIWKHPSSGEQLTVGAALPAPPIPRDARPDGLVVFFERPWSLRRGRLQVRAALAVYQGRVGRPEMSLDEAKTLCANTPSI